MQSRKEKSFKEMERRQDEMEVSFVSPGQGNHLTVHQVNIWL